MAPDDLASAGRVSSLRSSVPRPPGRLWRLARVDLRPGAPPSPARLVIATLTSVALSLALDVLAVHVATSAYPRIAHFTHFRAADYGTLTVVGVLAAAGAWAVLVRLSSSARWLFFRLAVVATLALWVPDGVLFALGQRPAGVTTLMVMHLAIAVVTYNLLVRVAPAGRDAHRAAGDASAPVELPSRLVRRVWSTMALVVVLELVLGVAVIVSVPFRRPAAVLPGRGIWIYAAHGAVGLALGAGALAVLFLSTAAGRIGRIGAVLGMVGVLVGVLGGVFATFQQTRLLGMGIMLVGVVVAGVGYLAPSLEAMGKAEAAKAEAARAALAAAQELGAAPTAGSLPGGAGTPIPSASGPSTNGHAAPPPSG